LRLIASNRCRYGPTFTLAAKVGKTASQPRAALALAAAQKNLQRTGPYSRPGFLAGFTRFYTVLAKRFILISIRAIL